MSVRDNLGGGITKAKLYEALQYSGLVTEDMKADEMLVVLAERFPYFYHDILAENSILFSCHSGNSKYFANVLNGMHYNSYDDGVNTNTCISRSAAISNYTNDIRTLIIKGNAISSFGGNGKVSFKFGIRNITTGIYTEYYNKSGNQNLNIDLSIDIPINETICIEIYTLTYYAKTEFTFTEIVAS